MRGVVSRQLLANQTKYRNKLDILTKEEFRVRSLASGRPLGDLPRSHLVWRGLAVSAGDATGRGAVFLVLRIPQK